MNILFILIATIPIIIGMVWIYKSFMKKLEYMDNLNIERFQHVSESFIPKLGKSRTLAQDEFLEEKIAMEFDRKINKVLEDVVYYKNSCSPKEKEMNDYLEHRFRAQSDNYAMNKKIDKIKNEYDESIFTDSLGNKLDYRREDISWYPPATCRCKNKEH